MLSRRAARQKELDGLTTSVWASLHGLAVLMSRSVLPARMSSSKVAESLRKQVVDHLLASL